MFKQKSFISLLRRQLMNLIHFVSLIELRKFLTAIMELDFWKLIKIVGPTNVTLKIQGKAIGQLMFTNSFAQ